MFKLEIEYKDYNDNDIKETVLFHFTQDEMLQFIKNNRSRLRGEMSKAIAEEDYIGAYQFVRELVLDAYGEKSEDGLRFIKNDDTRLNLTQTPRLDAVIEKVFTSEESGRAFVQAILPPKMVKLMEDRLKEED